MNLRELVETLKKYYFYIFVGLIFLSALFLIYVYLDNPRGDQGFGKINRPEITSHISSKIKVNSSLSSSVEPERLVNVYKFSTENFPAPLLAEKLGVTGKPIDVQGNLFWLNLTNSFSFENKSSFTFNETSAVGPRSISEEKAQAIAENSIKSLGFLGNEVKLDKIKTSYLVYGRNHQDEVTKTDNFTVFSFTFGVELAGISLVNSSGDGSIYSVYVGVDGKIKRMQGVLKKLIFIEKSTYPTKHLGSIKNEVENYKAKIINSSNRISSFKEISSAYTSSQLVYYLQDQKQQYLQPVFLLVGKEVYQENEIIATLEALKDESFK